VEPGSSRLTSSRIRTPSRPAARPQSNIPARPGRRGRLLLNSFSFPLLPLENVLVVGRPGQPCRPALKPLGVTRGVHILAYRDQLLAPVQADDVAGGHADVHNLLYRPGFHPHTGVPLLSLG